MWSSSHASHVLLAARDQFAWNDAAQVHYIGAIHLPIMESLAVRVSFARSTPDTACWRGCLPWPLHTIQPTQLNAWRIKKWLRMQWFQWSNILLDNFGIWTTTMSNLDSKVKNNLNRTFWTISWMGSARAALKGFWEAFERRAQTLQKGLLDTCWIEPVKSF